MKSFLIIAALAFSSTVVMASTTTEKMFSVEQTINNDCGEVFTIIPQHGLLSDCCYVKKAYNSYYTPIKLGVVSKGYDKVSEFVYRLFMRV